MKLLTGMDRPLIDYTGKEMTFNDSVVTVKGCLLTHLNSVQGKDAQSNHAIVLATEIYKAEDELEVTKDDFDFIIKETERPLHTAIVRVPFKKWLDEMKEQNKDR